MKKICFCIGCLLLAAVASANPPAPVPFNTYDGLQPGGRAAAMGMAYAAMNGDPASVYYNPAGLTGFTRSYLAITYEALRQSELSTDEIFSGEPLRGRNLMFLCIAGQGGALSWRPVANMTRHDQNGADWTNEEIKVDGYSISVSHASSDNLSIGLTLSYLSGQIAQSSVTGGIPSVNISDGYGMAADFGILYTVAPQLSLGMNLQNLGGMMFWEDFEAEQLPFILRTGFAYHIGQYLTFASDWERRYYRAIDPQTVTHFGIEQAFTKWLSLRAGIYGPDLNDQTTTRITAGLGYTQNDYSLSLSGEKYLLNGQDVFRYVLGLNLPM
jgi:hypothetical protein